jgi:hypothetical protein
MFDSAELSRRKRWERSVLRDALRGHVRVDPTEAWFPGLDVLADARHLLRAGGTDEPRRGVELGAERLGAVMAVLPFRGDRLGPTCDRSAEQGVEVLAVATDAFALGGRPSAVGRARERFDGPVLAWGWQGDEAEVAVAAALGADGVIARTADDVDARALAKAARCYGLTLWWEVCDARSREDADAADGLVVLRWDERDPGAALERSCRWMRGWRGVAVGAGAPTLRRAQALRRAGADALLAEPGWLDRRIEEVAPQDEPALDPMSEDPELLAALALMGADPTMFRTSSSGLLLLSTEPVFTAPEPELPPLGALDVLRVRRPRGPRL